MKKFWLFFYSLPNLVGLSLAVVGLLLYVFGIMDNWWYLIIPALYLIGLLLVPNDNNHRIRFEREMSAAEIRHALDDLLRQIKGKVPEIAVQRVSSIKDTILTVLPQIQEGQGNYDAFRVKQTALEYLPQTLENYLNLPSAYANMHQIRDGKTAKQLLVDQLGKLDDEMQKLMVDLVDNDAQKMLVHDRFLDNIFAEDDIFS